MYGRTEEIWYNKRSIVSKTCGCASTALHTHVHHFPSFLEPVMDPSPVSSALPQDEGAAPGVAAAADAAADPSGEIPSTALAPTEAVLLNHLGVQHVNRGQLTEAHGIFESALAAAKTDSERAWALTNIGAILDSVGDNESALRKHLESLALLEASSDQPSPHASVGDVLMNIGASHVRLKETAKADAVYKRAEGVFASMVSTRGDPESISKLATVRMYIGRGNLVENRHDEAIQDFESALQALQAGTTPMHESQRLEILGLMAEAKEAQLKLDETEAVLRTARDGWRKHSGEATREYAEVLVNLGRTLLSKALAVRATNEGQRQLQAAQPAGPAEESALPVEAADPAQEVPQASGEGAQASGEATQASGEATQASGEGAQASGEGAASAESSQRLDVELFGRNTEEVSRLAVQASVTLKKLLKDDMRNNRMQGRIKRTLIDATKLFARCLLIRGEGEGANRQFMTAAEYMAQVYGEGSLEVARHCSDVSDMFEALKYRRIAVEWLKRSIDAYESYRADNMHTLREHIGLVDEKIGIAAFAIATLYAELREFDLAKTYFKKTYKITERRHGAQIQALGCLKIRIGQCYQMAGKLSDAVEELQSAMKMLASFPADLAIAQELYAKCTAASKSARQASLSKYKPKSAPAPAPSAPAPSASAPSASAPAASAPAASAPAASAVLKTEEGRAGKGKKSKKAQS